MSRIDKNIKKISKLKDLAELAGCSIATASRALHDDLRINELTKSRIWQIAYDYDFPLGKYLGHSKEKQGIISLVIPQLPTRTRSLVEPFLLELVAHIGDEARTYECDLRLYSPSVFDERALETFFATVGGNGALILGQGLLHEALNKIAERRRDFVVWGARIDDQKYCSVGSDNFGGGYKTAKHFITAGREKILFLGDTLGPEMSERHRGFQRAIDENSVSGSQVDCRLDVDAAEMAIDRGLANGAEFDAIVAVNDVAAIGAINALAKNGVSVPQDVSIIGYDDIDYCRFVRPSLSTISQNSLRSARSLVSKVMTGGLSSKDSEEIATELILRES